MRILRRLLVFIAMVTECSCKLYRYTLDSPAVCQSTGVVTQWIEDEDEIIIHGKVSGENHFNECVLKFGPSSKATKLSSKIKFETYYNNNCGVYLAMQQSPYTFFDRDVTTVFNFSCKSRPGKSVFYTDGGNNIKIFLHKTDSKLLNYNFMLNVTLTDAMPHQELTGQNTNNHVETGDSVSTAIIIGIGVIIGIAIPGVGCIIYRYLKIKRWTKHQYEQDDQSPQSLHRMSHHTHSSPPSIRYSSMPLGDTELSDNFHSQTCVVGSQGQDGRCTVCNRSHEDFAHVVDLDGTGHVHANLDSVGFHRNLEEFAHVVEINNPTPTESPRARTRHAARPHTCHHRNDQSSANNAALRIISPPGSQSTPSGGGLIAGNDWTSDDDDADLDVSGNDLIPPSYDLSPPSYDEAVSMPKPNIDLIMPNRHREDLETDPLYQNLDALTSNER